MDKTCYTCLFEKAGLLNEPCLECVDLSLWMSKNTKVIEYHVEGGA